MPVSASPASSAGRCSGGHVSSVTTTARFCGSTGASSAPARAQQAVADHHVVARRWQRAPCSRRGGRQRQQRVQHRARWCAPGSRRRSRRSRRPRHRPGGARPSAAAAPRPGSPAFSSGRLRAPGDPAQQRRQRGSAARREPPCARIAARVSGSMNAPPPVASTSGVAGQQPPHHPALALAELALAVAVEHLGDGAAGGLLDLGVGVAERQPEPRGQAAADRGLARAHQPDQHDGAAGRAGRAGLGRGSGAAVSSRRPAQRGCCAS